MMDTAMTLLIFLIITLDLVIGAANRDKAEVCVDDSQMIPAIRGDGR